jgi:hypothetical protein
MGCRHVVDRVFPNLYVLIFVVLPVEARLQDALFSMDVSAGFLSHMSGELA